MSTIKSDTILTARFSLFKAESSSHHINIFGDFYTDLISKSIDFDYYLDDN